MGRELGITDEEFDEAVHLAMTVGASKTLLFARAERSALGFTAAPVVPGSEAG